MSDHGTTPRTFRASDEIERTRRVRLRSDGKIEYADSTELALGDTTFRHATDATPSAVSLNGRIRWGTANGPIAAYVPVFAADDGKISASGTVEVGTSLEVANLDNDIIQYFSPYGST